MAGSRPTSSRNGGRRRSRPKVGLALGGGGARGLAHIGVLQVFEHERIPIDLIVGTSIGALIGGVYAVRPDARVLQENALTYIQTDTFRRIGLNRFGKPGRTEQDFFESVFLSVRRGLAYTYLLRRPSLFRSRVLERIVAETVPDRTFDDLEIPLAVSAVDLVQGAEVAIRTGSLRKAVLASISLPGFFPPVRMDGMLLADMGFLGAVPADVASDLGSELVVSVDVSPRFQPGEEGEMFKTGLEILFRLESISARALRRVRLGDSDVVVRPDVGDLYWADFSTAEALIEEGREAARRAVPEIRKALEKRRPREKK